MHAAMNLEALSAQLLISAMPEYNRTGKRKLQRILMEVGNITVRPV